MFNKFFEKQKLRKEAIQKVREGFVSWLEISNSPGWKVYEEMVNKKIENVKNRMEQDDALDGNELKKLQLALFVWEDVKRLPKQLESTAKGGK